MANEEVAKNKELLQATLATDYSKDDDFVSFNDMTQQASRNGDKAFDKGQGADDTE